MTARDRVDLIRERLAFDRSPLGGLLGAGTLRDFDELLARIAALEARGRDLHAALDLARSLLAAGQAATATDLAAIDLVLGGPS